MYIYIHIYIKHTTIYTYILKSRIFNQCGFLHQVFINSFNQTRELLTCQCFPLRSILRSQHLTLSPQQWQSSLQHLIFILSCLLYFCNTSTR